MADTRKFVKLRAFVAAASASAAPPFGPLIGQYGVNTSQFCKEFNDLTEPLLGFYGDEQSMSEIAALVVTVDVLIYEDRTYKFFLKKPSTSFLIDLFAAPLQSKPYSPLSVGNHITLSTLLKLARFKFPNLPTKSATKLIAGTARAIGVEIVL